MGFAKEPVPKPNEFLKAHEKEPKPKEVDPNGNKIKTKEVFILYFNIFSVNSS